MPRHSASTAAVERSEREIEALELVSLWLGPTDTRSAPEVSFDEQRITVSVRSFDPPPDPEPLSGAPLALTCAARAWPAATEANARNLGL